MEDRAQERDALAEKAEYDAKMCAPAQKRAHGAQTRWACADAADVAPQDTDQYNFTDPESRIMKNGNSAGFEQAYNAQAAVDQATLFIRRRYPTTPTTRPKSNPPWRPWPQSLVRLLRPRGQRLLQPRTNIAALERREIEPYIATGREPHHQSWQDRFAGEPEPPLADANSQVKMA